jgi:hypothetical protein
VMAKGAPRSRRLPASYPSEASPRARAKRLAGMTTSDACSELSFPASRAVVPANPRRGDDRSLEEFRRDYFRIATPKRLTKGLSGDRSGYSDFFASILWSLASAS